MLTIQAHIWLSPLQEFYRPAAHENSSGSTFQRRFRDFLRTTLRSTVPSALRCTVTLRALRIVILFFRMRRGTGFAFFIEERPFKRFGPWDKYSRAGTRRNFRPPARG